MSLYTELMQAGIKCDHWQSDLYVEDCPEARAVLANHGYSIDGWRIIRFVDSTGADWLDLPFGYEPFWERTTCTG